ncbi:MULTISPECIES: GAF domain-containing protein [Streptomyces]|nr:MULTISPECIES: GAF domain-containing protein [Streptomyces]MZD18725.1 hypothetical protein [Streptomyces sp. SID5476]
MTERPGHHHGAGEARMNRGLQLAQAFVALSDTYAAEFDPLRLCHRLVLTCRDLLDTDAAAVMIADARGSLRAMAATDEDAAFAELAQTRTGPGPCMDCFRAEEPVSVADMAAEHAGPRGDDALHARDDVVTAGRFGRPVHQSERRRGPARGARPPRPGVPPAGAAG